MWTGRCASVSTSLIPISHTHYLGGVIVSADVGEVGAWVEWYITLILGLACTGTTTPKSEKLKFNIKC